MLLYSDIRKFFCYAVIAFVLLLTSGADELSNSKEVQVGGWMFFTIVYFILESRIKPKFVLLTVLFLVISALYYLLNDAYNYVTYFGFFLKIYIAYYCRELCKEHFFDYFINVIYFLTCISLVMYPLQLINFDLMYDLNNLFGAEKGFIVESNSVLFTMVPIHVIRNCGFMWEPGAFVSVLMITFYINLFKRGEPISARKNIAFLIAILTTQSTMGIIALLIPLALLMKDVIMKNQTYQRLAVIIVPTVLVVLGVIFTQVDFLYNKIVSEVMSLDEEFAEIEKAQRDDYVVCLTRTASVIVDMRTIRQYPLLGLGVDMRTVGFNKLGVSEKLETACGTTILLIRFGIVGFCFYLFLLYRYAFFDTIIHKIGWVLVLNYILFTQEFSASSFFHLFIF